MGVYPRPRKITTFGGPYRVVVTPDGKLAVTAGHGAGNGPDEDCVTIVDLTGDTPRAVDYVKIGAAPESFEISPDGNLLAAVVMNGSSTPAPDPQHSEFGMLTILKREGNTFVPAQRLQVGPIPEQPEERQITGDPRRSILERYPDRAAYVAAIIAAARELVAQGLMLEEDVARCADAAADWGRPRHDVALE